MVVVVVGGGVVVVEVVVVVNGKLLVEEGAVLVWHACQLSSTIRAHLGVSQLGRSLP